MQPFSVREPSSIFLDLPKLEGPQTIRVLDDEYIQGYRFYDVVKDSSGNYVFGPDGEKKMKVFYVLDLNKVPRVLPPDRFGEQRARPFVCFKVLHDGDVKVFVITQYKILKAINSYWTENNLPPSNYDILIEKDKKVQGSYNITFKLPSPVSLNAEQKAAVAELNLREKLGIPDSTELDMFLEQTDNKNTF